ncbi:hypothetical protein TL16_g09723 [Triparma laevis f. inornata]|uniref:Uncharacterized protein n=1 Tax=Triparma laevis f. inornata TaxID=1714386 RepID=A0A9W7BC59_9STRA|nr:hypothetical protein TL16_g09723 [Triparma laevis f. inornata]
MLPINLRNSIRNLLILLYLQTVSPRIIGADRFKVRGVPEGNDAWCKANCQSFAQCNYVFGADYVDLRLKTDFSTLHGPGEHLITGVSLGDTIAFEIFATQFILDLSLALGVSTCQFYVTSVNAGSVYHTWNANNVIVTFRLFPGDASTIQELTRQVQFPESRLYEGNVTKATDDLFGVEAVKWDASLKLEYCMEIVGGAGVKTDSDNIVYLNQGSERHCKDPSNSGSTICEFETFFIQDIAAALGLADETVEVLFIKAFGLDSVLVSFRFIPPYSTGAGAVDASWLSTRMSDLKTQVKDLTSALYSGNVTIRTDQTWGVSASNRQAKSDSPYLSYAFDETSEDSYERCKATHRCSRAWEKYDQSNAATEYTQQSFGGGEHSPAFLFADFEDWRKGTFSLRQGEPANSFSPATIATPENVHFNPFDYTSLGPSIPSYNSTHNNGLVLNNASLASQIANQSDYISSLDDYISFIENNADIAIMDAHRRARIDVRLLTSVTRSEYETLRDSERDKLNTLKNSQCANEPCELLFNTSSVTMTGAIDVVGELVALGDGTEVAVFPFDSIDIGPEVNITITGQRAMALLSRSTVKIDAMIKSHPGVLSGFPGGYSVGRLESDRLSSVCPFWPETGDDKFALEESADWRIRLRCTNDLEPRSGDLDQGLASCCPGDVLIPELTTLTSTQMKSNNVNGPGSGNLRVYQTTVDTYAEVQSEIQTVTTSCMNGENLGGGFVLHYNGYSTGTISFDATAAKVKSTIENDLNPVGLEKLSDLTRDTADPNHQPAGIGRVNVHALKTNMEQDGSREWTITFLSTVGNIGSDSTPLTVTNFLTGIDADIVINTSQDGNSIAGQFYLSFLSETSGPYAHDVTAADMQATLLSSHSKLLHAFVERTDPSNNCNDGYCDDGPTKEGGYTWTLTLMTEEDNLTPTSPTGINFGVEGAIGSMTAVAELTDAIGCNNHAVDSNCPSVRVTSDYSLTRNDALRSLTSTRPFSLAFGGGGAGYGGSGGAGYGYTAAGASYGDEKITSLLGGSGGQLGYVHPFEANMFSRPRGRGGAGGGALEIVAVNDIILGPNCNINLNGEKGFDAEMTAGGGGSGGALLLSAGGTITNKGKLSVRGGEGGTAANGFGRSDIVNGHGGGGSGGRIAMFAQAITEDDGGGIDHSGGTSDDLSRTGDAGTFYTEVKLGHDMYIDENSGAENSKSSLFLKNAASISTSSGINKRTPFVQNGPEYALTAGKPGRATFYVQLCGSSVQGNAEVDKDGWGTTFELRDADWTTPTASIALDNKVVIGIHVGKSFRHGSNYYGMPGDTTYDDKLVEFYSHAQQDKWYKVDIKINWSTKKYSIALDDVLLVRAASFVADDLQRVGLATYHSAAVRYDEIYVGADASMGFVCPDILTSGVEMNRPVQNGWKADDIGGYSSTHRMRRHESHLSRRQLYNYDNAGLTPFDGDGHAKFTNDVKFRFVGGDRSGAAGGLSAGALLKVKNAKGSTTVGENLKDKAASKDGPYGGNAWDSGSDNGGKTERYFWYGEHTNNEAARDGFDTSSDMQGGVGACSTDDFVTWKNEGIMFHYSNITDMVYGTGGPFTVERPKVLYNNATNKYVMWMTLDDTAKTLGLAGVAVSSHPNGPFDFVRSFYPDGNETHDQTVYQTEDGTAYLARTYYSTVDYVLPAPVMQPLWESVKKPDGSNNFGLSYHRAVYEPEYDDYHDIYLQRWRTEDMPWQIKCVNKITKEERDVPFGETNFDGEVCQDPTEYKIVIGQGQYGDDLGGVQTRFLDPNNANNSWWQPSSVPNVKAQPWSKNYQDGFCGIRKLDNDMHVLDPDLDTRDVGGRASCSNIVDNAVHPTPPDKLIGVDTVVEQRRAKYVAVSLLTGDYLDTSGVLKAFEGELEDEQDLISLIEQSKQGFGWSSGSDLASTYQSQVYTEFEMQDDWDTRFHQYEVNYNDRAYYSLACRLDGSCPVNFQDEVKL